jgi:quercetin dioxygenase-like cupin family protein
MKKTSIFLALLLMALAGSLAAQDNSVAKMATLKMGPLPVLPACATIAPTHGDPFKEAATIAIKMTTGCKIPWHWHSAGESLIIVSGKGKVDMQDHNMSETLGAGDTVYLAAKHHHQFTCLAACTFYDITEGAFDIHYIDKDGKEIQPEEALKGAGKAAKGTMKKGEAKK